MKKSTHNVTLRPLQVADGVAACRAVADRATRRRRPGAYRLTEAARVAAWQEKEALLADALASSMTLRDGQVR